MADNITTPAATVGTTPTTSPAPAQAQTSTKPEDMAAAFIAALDARTQRAERGVVKSFAEQYGMTDAEINAILADAKAKKAAAIPADVQAKIDAKEKSINDRLIKAEIQTVGAAMGLVDADTALQIIGRDKITIDDNGAVQGVQEALNALKESKPYFFGAQPTGATAPVGAKLVGDNPQLSGIEAAFLARNPGLKI